MNALRVQGRKRTKDAGGVTVQTGGVAAAAAAAMAAENKKKVCGSPVHVRPKLPEELGVDLPILITLC